MSLGSSAALEAAIRGSGRDPLACTGRLSHERLDSLVAAYSTASAERSFVVPERPRADATRRTGARLGDTGHTTCLLGPQRHHRVDPQRPP